MLVVVKKSNLQCAFEEVSIGCAEAGQAAPTKLENKPLHSTANITKYQ
jgi:hypothetical protein